MASYVNLSAYLGRQGDYTAAQKYAEKGLKLANETKAIPWVAWALTYQGHALAGLGKIREARQAYQEATQLRLDLHQPGMAAEPQAGLARLALAEGKPNDALKDFEPVLQHVEQGGNVEGTDEPLRVLFTGAQVLQAAGDKRWHAWMERACQKLHSLADSAPDEDTRRKLLEVSWNRDLLRMAEAERADTEKL
jgi:tetratricopeptide (TPR) repeat protein